MNNRVKVFFRSFIISFFAFSLIAAIVLLVAYSALTAVDPESRPSNVLVAALDANGNIFSISVVNVDPQEESFSFVYIPDNTLIEENVVLQSLYNKQNILELKKSIEDLLGVTISRYMIFTPEKISSVTNKMGSFEYSINYPFDFEGTELFGTVLMNGDMAKAMFSYQSYDTKTASLSYVGVSYLQSFLSKYSNEDDMDRLLSAIISDGFCNSPYTNLSEEELSEYASVFRKYPYASHKNVNIEGEYNETTARKYFIPLKTKSDKNIFEK